jgi:hypothetical protein
MADNAPVVTVPRNDSTPTKQELTISAASKSLVGLWLLGFLAVMCVEFIVVSVLSASPGSAGKAGSAIDAAALLTVITGAAVAIERIVEGIWTVLALFGVSDWWPLNAFSKDIQSFASRVSDQLTGLLSEAATEAARLKAGDAQVDTYAAAVANSIGSVQTHLNALSGAKLGSARLEAAIKASTDGITQLQQQYPEIKAAGAAATVVLDDFSSAVDFLKENPGRKIISLCLGMMLGMLVAGVFQLDLVQATLGSAQSNITAFGHNLKYVSIALTGLAIGLGSNPLHEVIGTLQQIKTSKKAANV